MWRLQCFNNKVFLYYFELNQIRASSASSNNSVGNSGIEIRETGLN